MTAGVLEWNKAFERIGFKDAIQVRVQPDDADFDTQDVRHASVRWYLDTQDGALAIEIAAQRMHIEGAVHD